LFSIDVLLGLGASLLLRLELFAGAKEREENLWPFCEALARGSGHEGHLWLLKMACPVSISFLLDICGVSHPLSHWLNKVVVVHKVVYVAIIPADIATGLKE